MVASHHAPVSAGALNRNRPPGVTAALSGPVIVDVFTRHREACARLAESGRDIITATDLTDAAQKVVATLSA